MMWCSTPCVRLCFLSLGGLKTGCVCRRRSEAELLFDIMLDQYGM